MEQTNNEQQHPNQSANFSNQLINQNRPQGLPVNLGFLRTPQYNQNFVAHNDTPRYMSNQSSQESIKQQRQQQTIQHPQFIQSSQQAHMTNQRINYNESENSSMLPPFINYQQANIVNTQSDSSNSNNTFDNNSDVGLSQRQPINLNQTHFQHQIYPTDDFQRKSWEDLLITQQQSQDQVINNNSNRIQHQRNHPIDLSKSQGSQGHRHYLPQINYRKDSPHPQLENIHQQTFSTPQPDRSLNNPQSLYSAQSHPRKATNTELKTLEKNIEKFNALNLSSYLRTTDQDTTSMSMIVDTLSIKTDLVLKTQQSELIDKETQAGINILNFLQTNLKIRNKYKSKVKTLLLDKIIKIQVFLKACFQRIQKKKGFYKAMLVLEGYQSAQQVQVFGEFTTQSQGPWLKKQDCQRVQRRGAQSYGMTQGGWKTEVWIKMGHLFKFIIDQGQAFVMSNGYLQQTDHQGNSNNVFRFHKRTDRQDSKVQQTYPLIRIPDLPKEDSEYNQNLPLKLLSFFDIDEEIQFNEYSKAHNAQFGLPLSFSWNSGQHASSPQPKNKKDLMQRLVSENPLDCATNLTESGFSFRQQFKKLSSKTLSEKHQVKNFSVSQRLPATSQTFQLSLEQLKPDDSTSSQSITTAVLNRPSEKSRRKSSRTNSTDFSSNFTPQKIQILENSPPQKQEDSPTDKSNAQPKGSITLVSAGYKIAKPNEDNVCEDAFFVSDRAFGVADGVSGWNDFGFSSHAFSHSLMDYCKEDIENFDQQQSKFADTNRSVNQEFKKMKKNRSFLNFDISLDLETDSTLNETPTLPIEKQQSASQTSSSTDQTSNMMTQEAKQCKPVDRNFLHSKQVLQRAFEQVKDVGSSTAVVAVQNGTRLYVVNLGDSGFQLYRQTSDVTYLDAYSKEQTHTFNTPYQLSVLPSSEDIETLRLKGKIKQAMQLREILRKGKDSLCEDLPQHADEYTLDLKKGDVIITGSDGVYDNLFNHEIMALVQNNRHLSEYDLAKLIVDSAQAKVIPPEGCLKKVQTPYQRKYKKEFNSIWTGGKEDDITCVVTRVVLQ